MQPLRRRDAEEDAEKTKFVICILCVLSALSASLRSNLIYDFFDAKSFMNWAKAWQPSTGMAL
jgi:hypothetical protein